MYGFYFKSIPLSPTLGKLGKKRSWKQ